MVGKFIARNGIKLKKVLIFEAVASGLNMIRISARSNVLRGDEGREYRNGTRMEKEAGG